MVLAPPFSKGGFEDSHWRVRIPDEKPGLLIFSIVTIFDCLIGRLHCWRKFLIVSVDIVVLPHFNNLYIRILVWIKFEMFKVSVGALLDECNHFADRSILWKFIFHFMMPVGKSEQEPDCLRH